MNNGSTKVLCVEIFSNVKQEQLSLATSQDLYKKLGYDIKIVFTTNVAESSITFDKLNYVIDSGLELKCYYDYINNINVIDVDMTTQAQIIQRIGRTGRTNTGIAFHLYTKNTFDRLPKYPNPGILKIDLIDYIFKINKDLFLKIDLIDYLLQLLNYTKTLKNLKVFVNDLITRPDKIQFHNALLKLKFLKCLSKKNNEILLSTVGYQLLKFKNISLLSSLAILFGNCFKCRNEIIIIMAIIELTDGKLPKIFNFSMKDSKLVNLIKKLSVKNSDHLTVLNIYQNLWKKNKIKFLNVSLFTKIDLLIQELLTVCAKIPINKFDYIAKAFNIINKEPYNNIHDNILFIISKSHSINLIDNNVTVNNIVKIKGMYNFSEFTKTDVKSTKYKYGICNKITKIYGRVFFSNVSLLPKYIEIQ